MAENDASSALRKRRNRSIINALATAALCVMTCVAVIRHNSVGAVKDCFSNIRENVDVAMLQAWATNLLNQYPVGGTNSNGPFDAPSYLSRVCQNRKPSVYIQGGLYGEEPFVRAFWGGGTMGHWGVKIGSPSFFPRKSDDINTKWVAGAYFFENYR